MEQIHNKLVRDKIIEKIEQNGETAIYRVLPEEEKLEYLKIKLSEEMSELTEAIELKDPKKVLEESADILEVIIAINSYFGVSFDELINTREYKKNVRGSFEKGIFLEKTL